METVLSILLKNKTISFNTSKNLNESSSLSVCSLHKIPASREEGAGPSEY